MAGVHGGISRFSFTVPRTLRRLPTREISHTPCHARFSAPPAAECRSAPQRGRVSLRNDARKAHWRAHFAGYHPFAGKFASVAIGPSAPHIGSVGSRVSELEGFGE